MFLPVWNRNEGQLIFVVMAALFIFTSFDGRAAIKDPVVKNLRWDYSPQELSQFCSKAREDLFSRVVQIEDLQKSKQIFSSVVVALELQLANFSNKVEPLYFLKYVSTDENLRTAAGECETLFEKVFVDLYSREKLYNAFSEVKSKSKTLSPVDAKVLGDLLKKFERNGLNLSMDKRKLFLKKKKQLIDATAEFSKNLNEWEDSLQVTEEELNGLPQDYISALEKVNGRYKITMSYPHYYTFMQNAKDGNARRKLQSKFFRRGGRKNVKLLEEAIVLRSEMAELLGFDSHAAFVLDDRMAGSVKNVREFLNSVRTKLRPQGVAEIKEMAKLKAESMGAKGNVRIEFWDWRYYGNQLTKKKHDVDPDEIKPYFPLEQVNAGMFDIYQTLLGVEFAPSKDIPTWHESVKAYSVTKDGKVVAYFYLDLFPRPKKYSHAAAFTLINGHERSDGSYQVPVSAVVANFNPPTESQPSLLLHTQVETHLHEFGHIMHQVLTRARYVTQSGTSVKRDFVEAPSQMLESWAWEEDSLAKLSGHYKDRSRKIPKPLVKRMLEAKLSNVGVRMLRQVFLASVDLKYHTSEKVDSTGVFSEMAADIMMIPMPPGVYFQAGFGHLMGGYDAGYYGYLWSEVYAADMFTRFQEKGLFDQQSGAAYRQWILEPGGSEEALKLVEKFIGRKSNSEAFFRSLGLDPGGA